MSGFCKSLKSLGHILSTAAGLAAGDQAERFRQGDPDVYLSNARRELAAAGEAPPGYEELPLLLDRAISQYELAASGARDGSNDVTKNTEAADELLLASASLVGDACGALLFIPSTPKPATPAPTVDPLTYYVACLAEGEQSGHTFDRTLEDCEPLRLNLVTKAAACAVVVKLRYYDGLGYSTTETAAQVEVWCRDY